MLILLLACMKAKNAESETCLVEKTNKQTKPDISNDEYMSQASAPGSDALVWQHIGDETWLDNKYINKYEYVVPHRLEKLKLRVAVS